ncbi:MAG: precorrin-4 C(11)-methyltransferase [Cyanobacteria bacterium P01_D01_bin.73]
MSASQPVSKSFDVASEYAPKGYLPKATKIAIVGAGPGQPDLITVRGQRYLHEADVVIYAGSLVPETLLAVCRPEAERVDTRSLTLEEWVGIISDRAKAGKKVVRLQDGDPSLYGATHELISHLVREELPFEIVPGVSAFQLAAARLNVELTIPHLVQTIILTRTTGAASSVPTAENLASLAAHRASLCLYLSAHHCDRAQAQLLEHYPGETPVAVCYRLGWDDEEIYLGDLRSMAEMTRSAQLSRTVLYLISPALDAFDTRPDARSHLYSATHGHIFRRRQAGVVAR